MAQKNYLAVVRPAKDKLDPTDALLLADLQEGGTQLRMTWLKSFVAVKQIMV